MYFANYERLCPDESPWAYPLIPSGNGVLDAELFFCLFLYWNQPNVDCRRIAVVFVTADGESDWAVVHFSLDAGDSFPGPFLDPSYLESEEAKELLALFVARLNDDPALLKTLQNRYIQLRQTLDDEPFRGKPFPKKRRFKARKTPVDFEYAFANLDFPEEEAEIEPSQAECLAFEALNNITAQAYPAITPEMEREIDANPALAVDFLEMIMARYQPPSREAQEPDPVYEACLALFRESLSRLASAIEQGRPWAPDIVGQVEDDLIERVFTPEAGMGLQSDVLDAFKESGLAISDDLKEANQELMSYYGRFWEKNGAPDLNQTAEEMVRDGADGPFELAEILLSQFLMSPSIENQLDVLEHIAENAKHAHLGELLGLMLLHPEKEVRHRLPVILEAGLPHLVSPPTLRRMIALRNWIPDDERPAVDALIKKSRLARIECAPNQPAELLSVRASPIDGSGAQALCLAIRRNGQLVSCNALFKLGHGVRDAFLHRHEREEKIREELDYIDHEAQSMPVDREYVDLIVPHFIGESCRRGEPPPLGMLQIADSLGVSDWTASPLDSSEVLGAMLDAMRPSERKPSAAALAVAKSDRWAVKTHTADSWFESDESVDRLLRKSMGDPDCWLLHMDRAEGLVLSKILQARRQHWLDQFIFTAVLFKRVKPKPNLAWKKFCLLAHAIQEGQPLREIPLMRWIANQTVVAAAQRAMIHEANDPGGWSDGRRLGVAGPAAGRD